MADKEKPPKACNVNIGVLGHIDSGKTSLCRALSTVTSTASMDKHPQSQERGITLDLGFSSFSSDPPDNFRAAGYEQMQFCLVDCPGHASLIRTVIGGAQIIDLCMLIVDVNKGIQTQTAECLVVAEILANQLVIVLNKVDMIPADKREKTLKGVTKKLRETFGRSKFGAKVPFAYTSANPHDGSPSIGIAELIDLLKSKLIVPERDRNGPFFFSFDHAFQIKGQGTVLTGTVLSGSVKPQQGIVVPQLGEGGKGKKVRSLQMFKRPVQEAIQGDRVAMCVAALDHKELERGIVLGEKFPVPTMDACICVVNKLAYFKSDVKTRAKFHITLGHQTVIGVAHFFCHIPEGSIAFATGGKKAGQGGYPVEDTASTNKGKNSKTADSSEVKFNMGCGALAADRQQNWPTSFDFSKTYLHLDELFQNDSAVEYENDDGDIVRLAPVNEEDGGGMTFTLNGDNKGLITEFRFDQHSGRLAQQDNQPLASSLDSKGIVPLKDRDRVIYLLSYLAHLCRVPGLPEVSEEPLAFCLLVLEKPVMCPLGSLLIGSKLDFEEHNPGCRLAFFGRCLQQMDPKELQSLRLLKMKQKVGYLDRFDKQDRSLMICRDMFKADTDMSLFMGLKIIHEGSGTMGVLEGTYGMEGLFKVRFPVELKVKSDAKGTVKGEERIALHYKTYDFVKSRTIMQ